MEYSGFYRVNYDLRNWALLIEQLEREPKVLSPVQRSQILDDSFELSRAGHLELEVALNATRYLKGERDYLPWVTSLSNFRYLDDLMQNDNRYAMFQVKFFA